MSIKYADARIYDVAKILYDQRFARTPQTKYLLFGRDLSFEDLCFADAQGEVISVILNELLETAGLILTKLGLGAPDA